MLQEFEEVVPKCHMYSSGLCDPMTRGPQADIRLHASHANSAHRHPRNTANMSHGYVKHIQRATSFFEGLEVFKG